MIIKYLKEVSLTSKTFRRNSLSSLKTSSVIMSMYSKTTTPWARNGYESWTSDLHLTTIKSLTYSRNEHQLQDQERLRKLKRYQKK